MKLPFSKTTILTALGAAAAYYFLIVKKQSSASSTSSSPQTAEEVLNQATQNAAELYNAQIGETVSAATMSAVDEEYNLKRQEYIKTTGTTPSRTLTYDQLQQGINDYNEKKKLLETYVNVSGDKDLSQEQAMGVAELELAITAAKKKKADEEVAALQAKKTAWAKRQLEIQKAVNGVARFVGNTYKKAVLTDLDPILQLTSMRDKRYAFTFFAAAQRTVFYKYICLVSKKTTNNIVTACNWNINHQYKDSKGRAKRDKLAQVVGIFSGVPQSSAKFNEYGDIV